MSTEQENVACPGCGSRYSHRVKFASRNTEPGEAPINLDLMRCPHCDGSKCCMCDMGDDVRCISCESPDDDGDEDDD